MNKFIKPAAIGLSALVASQLTSCCFEEGVSIKPLKNRLDGTWELQAINGESIGSEYLVELIFEKDGGVTWSSDAYGYAYSEKGEWEKGDKKCNLIIIYEGGSKEEYLITTLKKDKMIMEDDDVEYEFECVN